MSSPDEATLSMIKNLEAKTGRPMADWIALVGKSGREKHGEQVAWLKSEHAFGHGYANLVVHLAKAGSAPAPTGDATAAWFEGDKAAIKPVYDAVLAVVRSLGKDIELAPKKTYMSVRRSKQFACLHPSTKARFDLGLQLKGVKPSGRLEAAGSWNAMVTHRVRIESPAQVDREVRRWLQAAYDAA